MREPVRLVSEELGVPVGVVNPRSPQQQNFTIKGSFLRHLRPEVVSACQLAEVLVDADGRTIRRPDGW